MFLRSARTLSLALGLLLATGSVVEAAPPQPGAASADSPNMVSPSATAELTALDTASSAVTVHVFDERPDDEKGFVTLARRLGQSTNRVGDTVVVATNYEPICTLPCSAELDTSDRPIFFFMRDDDRISDEFRIPSGLDTATLRFKPPRVKLAVAGILLAVALVGIPMAVVARSRIWVAQGPPSAAQDFVRVKKVKR